MKKEMKIFLIGLFFMFFVSVVSATSISPNNCTHLKSLIEANCSANYELEADVNCAGNPQSSSICGFSGYSGILNGQGHNITGFSSSSGYCLFYKINTGSVVKNLGMESVSISNAAYAGALAAENYGSINNTYSAGTIDGSEDLGGLVANNIGLIENSYSICSFTGMGDGSGGGLVASNDASGIIRSSFATGNPSGCAVCGGLVGINSGTLTNSKAVGSCAGSGSSSGCTTEIASYFQGDVYPSKAPMSSWDFTTIWKETSSYPKLIAGGGGASGSLTATIISSSMSVTRYDTFIISSNVTCSGGDCGTVKAWLDPSSVKTVDKEITFLQRLKNIFNKITGYASGTLVSTVTGETPFFTTSDNPQDCGNMSDGNNCTNTWTINATGDAGDYEFYVKYNSTIDEDNTSSITISIPYWSGSGTSEDPYQITNCEDLQNVENSLSSSFILINDIDCTNFDYGDGKGFKPLGNDSGFFSGDIFNGNGYKIINLHINRPFTSYVGLFGIVVSSGILKNITLENVNITGNYGAGGLVGGESSVNINDSSVNGIVKGDDYTGGLVGHYSNKEIHRCSSSADVTGWTDVGGLVGFFGLQGKIYDSYANGSVTGGDTAAGGLVGHNSNATIINSYATGNVDGDVSVGGLIGVFNKGDVNNCFATGDVTGNIQIGGLIGSFYSGTINNIYYNNHSGNPNVFVGTGTPENMTAIQDNEGYFYSKTNPPMSSWDFTTPVWYEWTNDFPKLSVEPLEEEPTPTPTPSGGYSTTRISEKELFDGYKDKLYKNDRITFTFKSERHYVKLDKIEDNTVTIIITSSPITVKLEVGEEEKIDIDNDGIYDLLVRIDEISDSGSVEIFIQAISEPIEIPSVEPIPEQPEPEEEMPAPAPAPEEMPTPTINYAIIISAVIIILLVIISLWKRKHRVRKPGRIHKRAIHRKIRRKRH